ncbi:MAG TPA: chitobiase/beta-hexosaminidase C-terminal domain-containing protein [Candidatus Cloacimonadota bacterium]|nr:chitobiase/beta-hexosaminidase C-terminal domain-containing protein [Candidatus Cloacimonadota bacterium]
MKRTIFVILLAVTALTLISCSKSTAADDSPLGIPEFNPAPGSYGEPVSVLIHCATHGAEIRYTTDGSFPTVDSQLYTGLIPINTDTHFKARAFMPGRPPSPVVSADYIFSASAVEAVSLSPAGGFYQQSFTLSMSCATPDAEIRYTLNEADPDQNSLLYSTPILIDGSVTVKAKAFV